VHYVVKYTVSFQNAGSLQHKICTDYSREEIVAKNQTKYRMTFSKDGIETLVSSKLFDDHLSNYQLLKDPTP
jgi:hypothetical protein